jgi:hypothetical protein
MVRLGGVLPSGTRGVANAVYQLSATDRHEVPSLLLRRYSLLTQMPTGEALLLITQIYDIGYTSCCLGDLAL